MHNCQEQTFYDDTEDSILRLQFSQELGVADPYAKGCDELNQNFLQDSSSMMLYSYTGGQMDPNGRGFWVPKDYDACTSVNNDTLQEDIQNFDMMLDNYHKVYPNARFTIIGHSLGGLLALQGAYDYVINHKNSDIDKIITVDSPLKGVQPDQLLGTFVSNVEAKICSAGHSGKVVTSDLESLGNATLNATINDARCDQPDNPEQTALSWCKGQILAEKGVGVFTLGNLQDSLYCGGATQKFAGLAYKCYTQTLGNSHLVLSKFYDLQPSSDEDALVTLIKTPDVLINLLDTNLEITVRVALGLGHGTILHNLSAVQDIIRYTLSPVVSITQPTPGETAWLQARGTPVQVSATVRCLWGKANHASLVIAPQGDTSMQVGTFTPSVANDTLRFNGIVNIPPSVTAPSATLYVEANGDACGYPVIHLNSSPGLADYYGGGIATGVSIFFDGGELALGFHNQLYVARVNAGFLSSPHSYPSTALSQQDVLNTITDVAWSPDGTHIAYLVETGESQSGSSSELFVATSQFSDVRIVSTNLPNAEAITWNSSSDRMAILEELQIQQGQAGQLPNIYYQPSIAIIDAATGAMKERITLPQSANQSDLFCEITCYSGLARIQWGKNGAFLISRGDVGSTLVVAPLQGTTVMGQATELETISSDQFFGPDMAPIGALNEQGTSVAFPLEDRNTGNVEVNLYQVNLPNGKLGAPTTLASFTQNGLGVKVDFSPNNDSIAVCADKGVYVIDMKHPRAMKTLVSLPGQVSGFSSPAPSLSCDNLRWSPDGQTLLVQLFVSGLAEYGNIGGWALLPLNGSQPQVIYGCGISAASSGLQVMGGLDPNCKAEGGGAFDWQPEHAPIPS
jgi:hypothetical protein